MSAPQQSSAETSPDPSPGDPTDAPSYARDRSFWAMTKTQFLGAFNDNVFKQLVLLMCLAYGAKVNSQGDTWSAIAQAAFALPFVLFSGYGGYLADRCSKRSIVVLCKVGEIVVMLMAALVLLMFPADSRSGLFGMYAVLFLMGAQSAFFGPAKYGILPEMLRERDLPPANGLIQMTTFLAIIFGTVAAGAISDQFVGRQWVAMSVCVGIAMVGTVTSLLIRKTQVAQPNLEFSKDSLWLNRDLRTLLWEDRLLLRVLLTTTLFWFLGGAILPAFNGFGKSFLGLSDYRTSVLAAAMGVGIAIGCPVAGMISKGSVRFGMVRIGGFGLFATLTLVGLTRFMGDLVMIPPAGEEPGRLAWEVTSVRAIELATLGILVLMGFFGGLLAVPLQVFLQARPPKEQKGRMIGSMNLVNWIGILLASVFYGIASGVLSKGNPLVFVVLGLIALPVTFFRAPQEQESSTTVTGGDRPLPE